MSWVSISIHPPRAGRDLLKCSMRIISKKFQSTRPVRGGTMPDCKECKDNREFQSTRPVRGGTTVLRHLPPAERISIHPPRAGRDTGHPFCSIGIIVFQSTRPVRGGTLTQASRFIMPRTISIHPPRAGRDSGSCISWSSHTDFNPPAPCGAGRCFGFL